MKSQFTPDEWKLLLNAPRWVYAAMAAAERGTVSTRRTEAKALDKFLAGYKVRSTLVKEIVADQGEADDKLSGSLKKSEEMLGEINALLERKAGGEEGEAVRDMLMQAGKAVAMANREALFGDAESAKEEKALGRIETVLGATEADKRRRRDKAAAAAAAEAKRQAQEAKAAEARAAAERRREEAARAAAEKKAKEAEAEAKRKAAAAEAARRKAETEAARRKAEAEAKKKAEEAEAARRKAEAEAKKKAEEEAAKLRAEAEALRKAEEKEAKSRVLEAKAKKQAEAKAAADAAAKAEKIYVVKKGDTLSHIALEVYGNAGRWKEIFEANRDIIKKPNLIRPGWKLRIP